MDSRDAFVHDDGALGAEARQWLQSLPGTVYVTDSAWWLGELRFVADSIGALGHRPATDYLARPELWLAQIPESERRPLLERLQQALNEGELSVRLSYAIERRDGSECQVDDSLHIQRDADGEIVTLVGFLQPRPPAVPANPAAPADEAGLSRQSLLDHSGDVIMALDEDLECHYAAGNTQGALGVSAASLLSTSLFALMAPEDGSRVRRLLIEGAAEASSPMVELRLRHRDGGYRWFEIHFSPYPLPLGQTLEPPVMPGWVAIARDITQRRQQSLQWNAYTATDELTSALNRVPFMGLMRHAFASGDVGARFTLIVFDVDHFSDINRDWGREGGDLVLSCIGEMCRATLRERFSFGRLGDDSFALLMSGKSLQETAAIADKLRGRLASTRVEFHGHWLSFSVSLGVAERRSDETAEAMLARAEAGMQNAKQRGRDRVQQAP
ncbi:diguanylate cyclase [Salinicola salarius]|uniref:sensor domain-containing diguanylate cyclase n=1 Tax=Salinicola salarius TaxID=430457 RepID=UPI0023E43144|nr:diguanylate cyclase [Salinicola salarius]MDF3918898.1 diguanylate cyclase [Salinicola salarius]